jgi:hypothetical protein
MGNYQEAMDELEIALTLNYEAHKELYEFFPRLESQKALYKIIEQFKNR